MWATNSDVDAYFPAQSEDHAAAGAIHPVEGESRGVSPVRDGHFRSDDANTDDLCGVNAQVANPQPSTKDFTIGDVQSDAWVFTFNWDLLRRQQFRHDAPDRFLANAAALRGCQARAEVKIPL